MNKIKLIIITLLFTLSSLVFAMEPIQTITMPRGNELHHVKTSIKDGILTIYFMMENSTDDVIKESPIDVTGIEYINEGRRYPVLKDADKKYVASPYGPYKLFHTSTVGDFKIDPGARLFGWLKFEAPNEEAWPLEITMPGLFPFTVEKPD